MIVMEGLLYKKVLFLLKMKRLEMKNDFTYKNNLESIIM